MHFIWTFEGVRIPEVITCKWRDSEIWIIGTALKVDHIYQWEATPMPNGWRIRVISTSGRVEEFRGPTFNLALEVAAAIRRTL